MRANPAVALILAATVLLSGCGSGGSGAQPTDEVDPNLGTIAGLVTDDESQPVEGVLIELKTVSVSPLGIKVYTNSAGRFMLQNIPSGRQTLTAVREGFQDASTTVTVIPSTESTVRIILKPAAITVYKVVPLAPIEGFYQCAAEYHQASGACDFEVYNHTGTYPLGAPKDNTTFEVPSGWGGLLFEVSWQWGQGQMEGIRFQLESDEDPGGMFVKQEATDSPLRVAINAGQVAPEATLGYPIPQRGLKTYIHVLPLGFGDGATCEVQCGKGVGVALELRYVVYVTIFFGGPVDPNYSASTNG